MKILILDRDSEAAELMASALRDESFEVVTCLSVKNGLKLLDQFPDIRTVIVDLSLPHGGATDFLTSLKSSPRYHHVNCLVCSVTADSRIIKRSIELGAKEFILKPVSKEILFQKIRNVASMQAGPVLVVDDDPVIVDLLKRIVSREGFEVLAASSGQEALEKIEGKRIFAIISDICMPGISGLELLIKVKETRPSLPVLLITGQIGKFSRDEAIAAGADGFIAKPFKNVEISTKLRALGQTSRRTAPRA